MKPKKFFLNLFFSQALLIGSSFTEIADFDLCPKETPHSFHYGSLCCDKQLNKIGKCNDGICKFYSFSRFQSSVLKIYIICGKKIMMEKETQSIVVLIITDIFTVSTFITFFGNFET